MLIERNLQSLNRETIGKLDKNALTEYVIEGNGGVTLAEVLVLALISDEQRIPQNVFEASLYKKGEQEKSKITFSITDWNAKFDNQKFRRGVKDIVIMSLAGSFGISDNSDPEVFEYRQLKLQNLQTTLDIVFYELSYH